MPSRFRLDRSPKRAAVMLLAASAAFAASPTPPPPVPPSVVPGTIAPHPALPRGRPAKPFPAPPYAPHAPGEVIVRFRDGVETLQRLALRTEMRTVSRARFRIGAEQWRLPAGETVEQAIARLSADPRVEYAEPNYLLQADRLPDDPRLPEQYALRNTGQTGGAAGADVDAARAWNIATGDPSVLLAVIDTGIDPAHPDLRDNLFVNAGEIAGNGVDDDGNGFVDDVTGWDFANGDNDPFDDSFHGTHVSGIAAAAGNNGRGIAGVAWRARILPVKFLAADGIGFSADAIRSIDYATLMGARILNSSWGGGAFSNAMFDTISAVDVAGVLFVAAAGNDTENIDIEPHYPASYDLPNLIAVAATDAEDRLGTFSSYGAKAVLLGAPGAGILSTVPGGGYDVVSGTSMAAPMVSGAAALLLSAEPGLTIPEIRARLASSARPVPALQGRTVSGGRLDLFRLLAHPDTVPPAAVGEVRVGEVGSSHVRLRFTASGDDGLDGRASTYDIRYAAGTLDPARLDEAAAFDNRAIPGPSGGLETLEVTGLLPATTYQFAVRARDEWDAAGPASAVVAATTLPAPVFASAPAETVLSVPAGKGIEAAIALTNAGPGTLDWSAEVPAPPEATDPIGWISFVPPAGRVVAGATLPLRLVVSSAGLAAGVHRATVVLHTNDPARPLVEHGVTLQVLDASTLVVTPAAIDFDAVVLGTTALRFVTLANAGTVGLEVYGFECDDASVIVPDGLLIPPRAALTRGVVFAPRVPGPLDARLRISSSADNAAEIGPILVRGSGLAPPVLIEPDEIATALRAGDSTTIPVTLGNGGGSVLAVRVEPRLAGEDIAAPWLTPQPAGLTIPAGASAAFDLVVNAAGLAPGTHEAFLRFDTNAPGGEPSPTTPVVLTVAAGAHLVVEAPEILLESRVPFTTTGETTTHQLGAPIDPAGGGAVTLRVEGDYGSRLESARLTLEGRDLGTLRGGDPDGDNGGALPPECNEVTMSVPIDAAALAALLADRSVEAEVANGAAVNPGCDLDRHTLQIRYAPRLDRIDFGDVLAGWERRRSVGLRNTGSEPLRGRLTLAGDARFSVAPSGIDLAPGQAMTAIVTFRDAAPPGSSPEAAAAGIHFPQAVAGRLDVDSDDPDRPHHEIGLAATVTPVPDIVASPSSIATTLLEGRVEPRPVRLTNRGAAPVPLTLAIDPGDETAHPSDCPPEALYAAAFDTGEVRERDLSTGATRVVASGLFGPRGLAVSPDGRRLYATEFNGRLAVADLTAPGAPSRILLGVSIPLGVALDDEGRIAWVTSFGSGAVARVDLASGIATPVASGLSGPHGIALDPGGGAALVTEETRGALTRVDLEDGSARLVSSGLGGLNGLVFDPARSEAYAVVPGRGAIVLIDLVTGAVRDVATGLSAPTGLVFDPARRLLYVSELGAARVASVDPATGARDTVIASIPNPTGLALRRPAVCSARFARLAARHMDLPGGASIDAPLSLDSTGLAEGRRTAVLVVGRSAPFTPIARVPITLDVVARPRIAWSGVPQAVESTIPYSGGAARTSHALRLAVLPGTPGRLEVTVEGDFGNVREQAEVSLEGTAIGTIGVTGQDCVPATRAFDLPLAFLRAAAVDGAVEVTLQNSADVAASCLVNRHRVRLTYDNADPRAGLDLGALEVGELRALSLRIQNNGLARLDVTDLRTTDPQCTVTPPPLSVAPGAVRGIVVACTPVRGGPLAATLRLTSNDPDRPVLETSIIASVANRPPHAALAAPSLVECDRPLAGRVRLDGSGSSDPDSIPGTPGDIAAFEWFVRDATTGEERPVASGALAEADLPLGASRVVLRVTDRAGESSEAETDVEVRDTQAPAFEIAAEPAVLWPANHAMRAVRLNPSARDVCDPAPAVRLVAGTSSEPDDAPGLGDGTTTGDIVADAGCAAVGLRAERAGGGPGRLYLVVCEGSDASGNATRAETVVSVPASIRDGRQPGPATGG